MNKIESSTLDFLKKLSKNNNKEWFEANRKEYNQAKENFLFFSSEILENLKIHDSSLVDLDAKKCMFRINRDVRFSKDKSPYKTNFGISFSKGGKKSNSASYYIHLEPNSCFIGGGIWMPESNVVSKIRQEILYSFKNFKAIIQHKKFKETYGDLDMEHTLKKAPKGIDDAHEGLVYLKLTSYTCMKKIEEIEVLSPHFQKDISKDFKVLQPFIEFLNTAQD